jgi:hypothetical protein
MDGDSENTKVKAYVGTMFACARLLVSLLAISYL